MLVLNNTMQFLISPTLFLTTTHHACWCIPQISVLYLFYVCVCIALQKYFPFILFLYNIISAPLVTILYHYFKTRPSTGSYKRINIQPIVTLTSVNNLKFWQFNQGFQIMPEFTLNTSRVVFLMHKWIKSKQIDVLLPENVHKNRLSIYIAKQKSECIDWTKISPKIMGL